ncbi:MAG: tRNA1(Val) (adenine(37)-N6)-methyltransferase [Bacilli bacterium]|jgi:tRNA1(Val) A37 N6-methylase TrmN6|nr:tRNA1(Val) (adenine(37)-N6)-methyltransferase [Acholeplasmataceae bacterium]
MKQTEVINDLLGYEGLKIIQRPDTFNFTLDSTLLAHFVSINQNVKNIIDLGCGNGPIPLFLSLRTKAKIIGVELQREISDLAQRSVILNGLEEQITIYNDNVIGIAEKLGHNNFDIVTCNPPYFKYHKDSNINKNDYLTIARHEVTLKLEDVLNEAKRLLKDGGTLAMVHRAERLTDLLVAFRNAHMEPKRIRFVYPKKNSLECLAVLIEGKNSLNTGGLKILKPLYVYDENHKYTEEILEIFNYVGKR